MRSNHFALGKQKGWGYMSSTREDLIQAIKDAAKDFPKEAKEVLKKIAGNEKRRGSS